ncbi:amidase [Massilia sp. DWR3-1-1]|uniref:amidase n=1 Tax=Massilia sp. DWR3-1-1 TaxID=2804559 RepID=UPI003CEE9337
MNTCLEWARLLAQRQISSVQLTTLFLDRIAQLDRYYGAYRLVTAELALAQARAADAAIAAGIRLGPLQGVPYAAKDVFDVAGLPTSAGCDLLSGRPAPASARVIDLLQASGMVLLGKTNLVQFAHGSLGVNTNQGTPRNPWSPVLRRVAGGSSSGSSVAVATGMAPIALGTDTGGSVRVPAALCGTIGLKTTYGRVSRAGVYPLSPTLDSVGIIGNSADDIAVLLRLISGAAADADVPVAAPPSLQGMRLAFADSLFVDADRAVAEAVLRAGARLGTLGAGVSHIAFAEACEAELINPNGLISKVEGYAYNQALLTSGSAWLDQKVVESFDGGATATATSYCGALAGMGPLQRLAATTMAPFDALLAPAAAVTALALDGVAQSGTAFTSANSRYTACTRAVNVLGLCALSVPCALSAEGLPIGLQIIGRAGQDEHILAIAQAWMAATYQGGMPRPPLARDVHGLASPPG